MSEAESEMWDAIVANAPRHVCTITEGRDKRSHVVQCLSCGYRRAFAFRPDAEAVAARHMEVQGVERRS